MDSMVFDRNKKSEFVRFLIRGGVDIAYNARHLTVAETWWIQVEGAAPMLFEHGKEYYDDGIEVAPPSKRVAA